MSIGLGENVGKSFGFAFENTLKHIGRWLGMAILLCIPIVHLIVEGMFLKVFRNEEPDFSNAGKSFVQGLLATIIGFIYFIIPTIIVAVIFFVAVGPTVLSGGSVDAILAAGGIAAIICTIVAAILFILVSLILIPATINFARNGFGAAFKFGEIFAMIGKVGLGRYILAIILLILVGIVIGIVLGIIWLIPILGIIVDILAMPILLLFEAKYFANIFE